MKPQQIALYGKSGVGKSTIAANLGAAIAEQGLRVIIIGCDPASASTSLLRGGREQGTVLDMVWSGRGVTLQDVAVEGYAGVVCVELGDFIAGSGCAGRGMEEALSSLKRLGLFEEYRPDVVFYDIPGEIACGGFAAPIRTGFVNRAVVVSSADFVSLYAANNIFRTISTYAPEAGVSFGGIIANGLTTAFAESYIADFAERTRSRVRAYIPRSLSVLQSELYGKTVIQSAPKTNHAFAYRRLAASLLEEKAVRLPQALEPAELRQWAKEWGDRIRELELGFIDAGAAI